MRDEESQCARAPPEPWAWMPGQEQSWPRAQCSRALGSIPPASAQATPTVQPIPPSLPTPDHCTACFSLEQSHHSFPLTLLALCLEVTFFVFKLGVEDLAPWLSKCFFPAWQKPLGIVVVGGREGFPFSTCRRETEA